MATMQLLHMTQIVVGPMYHCTWPYYDSSKIA